MNPVQSTVLAFHFELEGFRLIRRGLAGLAWTRFRISAQQRRSLAQQFLGGVAREFVHEPIGVNDPAVGVQNHYAFRKTLQRRPIERL
jgi:hypothetical protein